MRAVDDKLGRFVAAAVVRAGSCRQRPGRTIAPHRWRAVAAVVMHEAASRRSIARSHRRRRSNAA